MQKFKSDLTTYFFKSVLKTIGFNDTGLPLCPDALILYLNERSIKLTVFKENSGKWNFIGVDMGLKYDHTFTENFTPFDNYEQCRDAGIIECCCYLNLQHNTDKTEEHKAKPIGPRGPGLKLFKSKLDEEKHDEELQEEIEEQEEIDEKKYDDNHEWVDLGLPSGLLWKCKPEEGEFTTSEAIIHECQFIDGERIPGRTQFEELIENCKIEFKTNDDFPNGYYIFESNINGNTVVIPVIYGKNLNGDYTNKTGFWTSTPAAHHSRQYVFEIGENTDYVSIIQKEKHAYKLPIWFCKSQPKQDGKIADSTYVSHFN